MGSGRGDRNQDDFLMTIQPDPALQWGPVVVTGISVVIRVKHSDAVGFNGVRSW